MNAFPVNVPGWLVLVSCSLFIIVCAFGDGELFLTKQEIVCQMAENLRCDGTFASMIFTVCKYQQQRERILNKKDELSYMKDESSHGSKCKRNRDCKIKKSVCYSRVCLCELGLYFSREQNACLRECEEYGDEMDTYTGAGIKDHNDKVVFNATLSSCCDLCVWEKSFTCLTVDWDSIHRGCYLSKIGYQDVTQEYREHNQFKWRLAQRQCK